MSLHFDIDAVFPLTAHKLSPMAHKNNDHHSAVPLDFNFDPIDVHHPALNYVFSPEAFDNSTTAFPETLAETPSTTDDGTESSLLDVENSPSQSPKTGDLLTTSSSQPRPTKTRRPRNTALRTPSTASSPDKSKTHSLDTKPPPEHVNDKTDYEARIGAGMALVKAGTLSIRAAAKKVRVSHETLRRRYQGATSRQQFHTQLMALTPAEEQTVEDMLLSFKSFSNMLTSSFLCNLVNDFRRHKARRLGQPPPKDLGISWTAGFRRRHEVTSNVMSRSMNKDKPSSSSSSSLPVMPKSALDQWFADLAHGCALTETTQPPKLDMGDKSGAQVQVLPQDMYNLVELGYYLDQQNKLASIKRSESKSHDTAIVMSSFETLSLGDSCLPSMQVCKQQSVMCEQNDTALSTKTGWADPTAFLTWLTTIFEPCTQTTPARPRAILMEPCPAIFDSRVLQFTLDRGIVFFLFPCQTPYVLQPADAGELSAKFNMALKALPSCPASSAQPKQRASKSPNQLGARKWATDVLGQARQETLSDPQFVTQAWARTGIAPFNPQAVKRHSSTSTTSERKQSSSASNTAPAVQPRHHTSPPVPELSTATVDLNHHTTSTATATATASAHALANLAHHYQSSLNHYFSIRPPLYFENGEPAHIQDEEQIRMIMGEYWTAVERVASSAGGTSGGEYVNEQGDMNEMG